MPHKDNQISNEETKYRIIKKSIELFNTSGCKSVTMDQISTNLHISKRTLYEIFDSKEALIMECLVKIHKSIGEKHQHLTSELQEPFLLTMYIIRTAAIKCAYYSRILNDALSLYPDLTRALMGKFSERFRAALTDIFTKAQQDGDLRDGIDVPYSVKMIDLYVHSDSLRIGNCDIQFSNRLNEICYTYLRGLLSVPAIQRYDEKEQLFKSLLENEPNINDLDSITFQF